MKREKWGTKGFTLIEMIFVLAIILTLIAIFIPLAMDKLVQSKTAKAQADIDVLATTLTNFFSDIGNFPSCNGADCDPLADAVNNLRFLAVCTGVGGCDPTGSNEYPGDTGGLWNLTANDEASPARNNVFNHAAVNDGSGNGITDEVGVDYRTTRWRGPYVSKLGVDPWGSAYIIHVGAMQRNGCTVDATGGGACAVPGSRGWILSAGPNGNLDTAPTATVLCGGASPCDDFGYIFCTNC